MGVSGKLHTPAALPPRKEPLITIVRRLGGPQSRSGRGGKEKNSQPPPGIIVIVVVVVVVILLIIIAMYYHFHRAMPRYRTDYF
jgi:hypothetical protein